MDIRTATVSGDDLRLLRLAKRVRSTSVARVLGVSQQRVAQIEAAAHPTAVSVQRYLVALARAAVDRDGG